jgi:dihydropteroate synthase
VIAPRHSYSLALPGGRRLELGRRTLVMGILNVTPDSFAEAGPCTDPGAAVEAAFRMEAEGADLLDIGGESTRPGADPVPADEELARVLPVLRRLGGALSIPISIDTYKARVAEAALGAGASMVNDVSGLRYDPGLAGVVAPTGAALVLMHTRGRSRAMYREAQYAVASREVRAELAASVGAAREAGIGDERLVVDPGLGFAKRPGHSYQVLADLPELASLGLPILVGPSRKSFLQAPLGAVPPGARDWGTAAAVTAAVLLGAHIVRVHAVGAMVQVVRVADAIREHGGTDQGAS